MSNIVIVARHLGDIESDFRPHFPNHGVIGLDCVEHAQDFFASPGGSEIDAVIIRFPLPKTPRGFDDHRATALMRMSIIRSSYI